MLLLAQASPSSSEIGTWVLVGILIINGIGAIGGLVAIFATRREVEAIEKRVMATEAQRDADLLISSERRAKIYAELKDQREDMLKLVDKIYDRIDENQKASTREVNAMPDRIITTLRHTGVIK